MLWFTLITITGVMKLERVGKLGFVQYKPINYGTALHKGKKAHVGISILNFKTPQLCVGSVSRMLQVDG